MESNEENKNSIYYNKYNRYDSSPQKNFEIEEEALIPKESQTSRILQILLCILPLIFLIIVFLTSLIILSIHELDNPSSAKEAHSLLKYMKTNLETNPIINILPYSTSSPCPNDYEKVSVGNFPGTNSGCLCQDDNEVHTRAYCLINSDCKYTVGIDSNREYIWRGENLCVKRLKNWKITSKSCSSLGMKDCYNGFCINGNICPISQVIIY